MPRPLPTILFATALSLAIAVSAAGFDSAVRVDVVAQRVDPPHPALLVSDSAWLGIKTYGAVDAVQGLDVMLDLGSCRRRVAASCVNYDGHVPITLYEEVDWRADAYGTLIVATGYNDGDRTFRRDVDAVVGLAVGLGYRRIVWLTLRENVSYRSPDDAGFAEVFGNSNRTLRELAAAGTHPELVVADWAAYAAEQDRWFTDDGIHLRLEGPWAAADYISRKLAFLDGRACPEPITAGGTIEDPCPDPDDRPPAVDLRALYPVGEPENPTRGFEMEWAGTSSWPDPPWWER